MKIYICPMHPDIKQDKPGRCPKCGMKLVEEGTAGPGEDRRLGKLTWKSYMPLIVIVALILVISLTVSYKDWFNGIFSVPKILSYFMIGFFLTFSGFKLLDLKGFAEGYSTYDLLAKKWFGYGYVYPFIELCFGLGMILIPESRTLLIAELIIMLFSGLVVAIKLVKKERFQCACLGTFLKVPLTKITLFEDLGWHFLRYCSWCCIDISCVVIQQMESI